MREEKCWKTLDGRVIPIRFLTTTHLGNTMTQQNRLRGSVPQALLDEWTKREAEGVTAKARRFIGRVLGNYYKGTAKFGYDQKAKFKKLNDEIVEKNRKYDKEFEDMVAQCNDDCYGCNPQDFEDTLVNGKSKPSVEKLRCYDGGLDQG